MEHGGAMGVTVLRRVVAGMLALALIGTAGCGER
jgi:hypothetical protein